MGCIWDAPATPRKAPEPVSRLVLAHRNLAHRNLAKRWEARAVRDPCVLWTSPRGPEGLYLAGEPTLESKSYNPPNPTRKLS